MSRPNTARRARALRLLALIVWLAACAGVPAPLAPEIAKSELDTREYRYLVLPNRMRVLLVSDAGTDKAAASMQVRAGSGDDPRARQGLAHFLEHMLFLGTGKYPDPGEYQAFINAHGGSHNAYTAIDHTNFFFDIEPASLPDALDRFAQFFVAPLFNPDYVEREMNAIDSEYRMGLKDDSRREYDVLRELVQPDHPLAQLAVGNLQTLRDGPGDIRKDLLAFYGEHYSANLMTLVVLGRESLDELQALVAGRFGAVADLDAHERTSAPPLFAPGTLPLELRIRPEKELRELTLLFPLPSERAHYAAKPLEYIANLLGHEGRGSLLSLLKGNGWVEGLSAGAGLDIYGEDVLQLAMQLTEAGLQHQSEIIALTFRAIELLKTQGVEEWRFREQGSLAAIAFRYREKGGSSAAAIGLAEALADFPVADVMRGPYLFRDFDRKLLLDYLGYLRPDNLVVTLSHKGVETDRESYWFKTPYAVRRLDAATLAPDTGTAGAALALPAANEFIPAGLALKPAESAAGVPALLAQEPAYRLWHLGTHAFPAPRASIYFQLLSRAAGESPEGAALTELYARMVQDQLNEFAYPATLAGLQYEVAGGGRGITVRIGGYDDRQPVLLDKILHALVNTRLDAARHASIKAELLREWGNSTKERPYLQLVDRLGTTLVERRWPDAVLRAALQGQDRAALEAFIARFRDAAALDVLVNGNYTAREATGIGLQIRSALLADTGVMPVVPPVEVMELPQGRLRNHAIAIDHPDAGVVMLIQGGAPTRAERARIALTAQIISAPFFDDLRTERQLGYAVFAQSYPMQRVPGLLLAVQSPNTDAGAVARAIDRFLRDFATHADAISDAEFAAQRAALVERLRESPKTLAEQSDRFWNDIALGAAGFDDRERVAREVESLSRADWQAYYHVHIGGPERRALLLYNRGSAAAGGPLVSVPGRALSSLEQLHRNAKYYRFDWGVPGQDT